MSPLLQGLWDLHIHGVAGVDFMNATAKQVTVARSYLHKKGVALIAPTLLTAPRPTLERSLDFWGRYLQSDEKSPIDQPQCGILGIHLEGPFLSPHAPGAHTVSALSDPSIKLFDHFYNLSRGFLAIITIAPELPGALKLIRHAAKRGVRVQMGHSRASAAETLRAVDAGASGMTHFFNAMAFHHRDPGLAAALLLDTGVTTEVIADGHHLSPLTTAWIAQSFKGRAYAVSDCCACAGLPQKRRSSLGPLTVERRGSIAVVAKKPWTLAGSALTLPEHLDSLKKSAKGLKLSTGAWSACQDLFKPPLLQRKLCS
jgi:N-acetylglucosamine-6-phosphate deacetylase